MSSTEIYTLSLHDALPICAGGGAFGRPMGGGPFKLGGETSSRRYNLTFSVNARNVLNRVNLATPIGHLNSPLFGESNSLAGGPFASAAANRKLELQAAFSFSPP